MTKINRHLKHANTVIITYVLAMCNVAIVFLNLICVSDQTSASHSAKPINIQGSYGTYVAMQLHRNFYYEYSTVYTKEDQVAALASFDGYHDLLILIDPNPLEEKLVQLKFFRMENMCYAVIKQPVVQIQYK